jgi:hypothetical protein
MGSSLKKQTIRPSPEPVLGSPMRAVPGSLTPHQRQSLRSLSSLIAKAVKFEELASVGLDIRRLAQRLIGEGLSATAVAKLMSHLNDAMTVRVIELVKADSKIMSPPTVPWAWLALGSEGRDEQTIATDQDNAIKTPTSGLYRLKNGALQLYNSTTGLYHTLTLAGAAGSEYPSFGAGEA